MHPKLPARYVIQRELGSGAFGAVYLATDTELDRPVAVKVLRRLAAGRESRERFRREATAAARLRHPHVLQVYDQGETATGDPFLVSEYLEGTSLDEVLAGGKAVEPGRARRWLEQIAEGLGAAHAAGVIHRDLKPANVMLRNDEAMLCDFGLAQVEELTGQVLEDLTRTGQSVGTPMYMAPEMLGGSRATPASDVWALGALGYRMLYGRDWRDPDMTKLVLEARTLPQAPAQRFGDFPEVDEALRAALHANPTDRLPSTEAFLAGLRIPQGALPPPGGSPPVSRWRAAMPGMFILAAAAGLAGGYLSREPPPPASPSPPQRPEPPAPREEPATLRRARRALDLAAPNTAWDIRRRAITHLTVELAEHFLEPTTPLALRRLIREAAAAREQGAPVGQAARGLARLAGRLNLVEDYLADSLVSVTFERGATSFDASAWRERNRELRQLGQDALGRLRPGERDQEVALHLALQSLANANSLPTYAERAAQRARRATPANADLLAMVTGRAFRRQRYSAADQLRYRRVFALFLEGLDPVGPSRNPDRARARREVLEALGWLLRIQRSMPSPTSQELFSRSAEVTWGDREVARQEVVTGYATVYRWVKPRGYLQDSSNPYTAILEVLWDRRKILKATEGKLPPVPAPGW